MYFPQTGSARAGLCRDSEGREGFSPSAPEGGPGSCWRVSLLWTAGCSGLLHGPGLHHRGAGRQVHQWTLDHDDREPTQWSILNDDDQREARGLT